MTADRPRSAAEASIVAEADGAESHSDVPSCVPDWVSGIELPGLVPLLAPARRVLAVLGALDGIAAPAAVIAAHADLTTMETLRHLRHLTWHGLAQPGKAEGRSFRAAPGPSPLRPAVLTFDGYARATAWYLGCAFEAARVLGVAELPGHDQITLDPDRPPRGFIERPEALAWFIDERDGLVQEVGLARELGDHAQAWRLALLMLNISCLTGPWGGWRRVYEHGIAATFRDHHRAARAMIEECAGDLELADGDVAAARGCHQRSLDIRSDDGDRAAVVRSIHALGLTWLREDSLPEAQILFDQAIELAADVSDKEHEALAQMSLGVVHARTGRTDAAVNELRAAIPLLRSNGWDVYVVQALVAIAVAHRLAGNLSSAEHAALEAQMAAVESGIPLLVPEPLIEHAHVQASLGHLRVARALLHEAYGIWRELGDESRAESVLLEIDRICPHAFAGPGGDVGSVDAVVAE